MGGMEKTTVYLTSEQKAALASAAAATGQSEARLIRQGIDAVSARRRARETVPALLEASLEPVSPSPSIERPRWIDRDAFLELVLRRQADPGLRAELRDLAPGTTDDEPIA
jgi:hypothetical protein